MQVDLFTDIVCPWCYIGTERLERVLASLGQSETTVVRHHPFMLRPDTPPDGIDIAAMLRKKYGVEPREIFARAEAAAAESGLPLDLSKQRRSYPTVRAHTLIRLAGPKGTQRALARDLFRAHFLEALNIFDVDVLVPIATRHGFTAEEASRLLTDDRELAATRSASDQAHRMGINGVPLYVFDGARAVSGAQPESVLRDVLLAPITAPA
jgi:predicted DsbA family dithiol-disulfide isomerase